MAYVLGLTGNIASGKTTVGLLLMELGADTYCDADMIVHELYLPGKPLATKLAQTFGSVVLDADGGVDRRVLGQIVFGDRARLRQLEEIVHPSVRDELINRMREIPADGTGILDAIKLVESGYAPFCHAIWVVTCPPEMQLQRLMERSNLSEAEARARIAAQPPLAAKLALATEVIDNGMSREDLRQQVRAAWDRFKQSIKQSIE
ncbi:MAG: dephospho-CoA kinase [Ktedonobacterales bacterium]